MKPITIQGGTMTTKGLIKHKLHPEGYLMPVMLDVGFGAAAKHELQKPQKYKGKLLYALPDGGVTT